MKAQMVKNAVIVPVGSKGGFVLKAAPPASDREAFLAEGEACYRNFLRGLLDVTDNLVAGKVVPKMTLVAPPREGGALSTRSFIPHVCHEAIGVLGAVSVATACVLDGSAIDCAVLPPGDTKVISVEHPTGEFTVQLETRRGAGGLEIKRAALLRTARRLFDGNALIPGAVWDGRKAA